ncbi:MAG TPA: HdeD family acid-resistance protein [Stellaceae bacterium]|nr:HdeD family acid-resistance protein [Stellaceae bacterium]
MVDILLRNWWALALRGVAALIFGVLAFLWPGITLTVLIWIFAAYMLVDGVLAVVAGLRAAQQGKRWWPFAVEGVLDLIAGAIAFLWPGIALLTFIYLIAFWAILSGVVLLAAAVQLRRMHGESLLILGGLLSLAWGVIFLFWPMAGALAIAWWIGAYAFLFGAVMVTFALRLRRRWRDMTAT